MFWKVQCSTGQRWVPNSHLCMSKQHTCTCMHVFLLHFFANNVWLLSPWSDHEYFYSRSMRCSSLQGSPQFYTCWYSFMHLGGKGTQQPGLKPKPLNLWYLLSTSNSEIIIHEQSQNVHFYLPWHSMNWWK